MGSGNLDRPTSQTTGPKMAESAKVLQREWFLLNSFLDLTRLQESRRLPPWLLHVLRTLFEGSVVNYYRVYGPNFMREFPAVIRRSAAIQDVERDEHPVSSESDVDVAKAIVCKTFVTGRARDGMFRLVYPVVVSEEVIAALTIGQPDPAGFEQSMRDIECLFGTYTNYLTLLHDSEIDPLTRLLNRRTFDARLADLISTSRQQGSGYSLAVLDIDHFKRINDSFGHLFGDEILIHLANVMRGCFRSRDLLFRYGGEEFVVVFRSDGIEQSNGVLERLRSMIELYRFPQTDRMTVSIGHTLFTVDIPTSMIVDRADKALYYAKEHGRNQVRCYEELVAAGDMEEIRHSTGGVELF